MKQNKDKVTNSRRLQGRQTSDKMKRVREAVDSLEPKRAYNATEIERLGAIPWARTSRSVTRILESGAIKVRVTGKGTQKRYLAEGAEIINYVKTYGPVLLHTIRKRAYDKNTRGKAGGKA